MNILYYFSCFCLVNSKFIIVYPLLINSFDKCINCECIVLSRNRKAFFVTVFGQIPFLKDFVLSDRLLRVGKKLLKQVGLFDVYRGDKIAEGKKQYALSFVLQDLDKTLTDNDVERVMSKLLSTFQNEFGASLR